MFDPADNIYPDLTLETVQPAKNKTFAESNATLVEVVTGILDIVRKPDDGSDWTYNVLTRYVHPRHSWTGDMVRYQEPVIPGSPVMTELLGYFWDHNVMRLSNYYLDGGNEATIYVRSCPPHGTKEWRVSFNSHVVCLDQQVLMTGFLPNDPIVTFDDLLTPEQQRIRDLLRAHCFYRM